jgi:branched-chain amino acid transport system permease protein
VDSTIFLILAQDGVTNAAIYALLALALVLVFAVTRVIFIPQGEFVMFGALTLASLQAGKLPGTVWLLLGGGVAAAAMTLHADYRTGQLRRWPRVLLLYIALPVAILLIARQALTLETGLAAKVALTLAIVVPLGPVLYRIAYQPLADASVLVLLIASVGVHFALTGLGLVFFGAEGSRTPAFWDATISAGAMTVSGQSICVIAASLVLIAALYLFFGRTLYGKALRATAVNRRGARLMGISTSMSGMLSFGLAALIGCLSGVFIAPITTIYYDSGFLVGLKGFVAAILGGLVSYPLAALGAVLVGMLESFSSFWASAYKEVIVFTLIIPVLLWRSMTTHHVEDEE